jgi:hypothetical protein
MYMTVLALVLGVAVLGVGVSIVFDLRDFGTRAIRLSLYTGAPAWSRNPEPSLERVDSHRVTFGSGVALLGLVILVASVLNLA